jgi:hypothetical protein
MLEQFFPVLAHTNHEITSSASVRYNCIAWAVGDDQKWWWPSPYVEKYYWPPNAPREETVHAFLAAFASLGFESCDSPSLEPGYQKVALFVKSAKPTHAARQLADGRWTSKLGRLEDIVHDTIEAIVGDAYGEVTHYLRRPVT